MAVRKGTTYRQWDNNMNLVKPATPALTPTRTWTATGNTDTERVGSARLARWADR